MPRPNIILINCDDLGYGDLACYGHPRHKTPHLDRLAAEGMRFTDFCMASSVCSPSRAAMMTGCFPNRVGFALPGSIVLFPGAETGLAPSEVTLARLLRDAGYATQLVGKWHCGDQPEFLPTAHGFDHYYGLPYSNDMARQVGKTNYAPLPLLRDTEVVEQQPDQASLTFRYAEESLRFIRAHRDRPFFLYLAHMYVHLPIYAPDRFLRENDQDPYAAAVACIDWVTGRIVDELKRLGLDENTLVVFTSDNGSRAGPPSGGSNGPLRGAKHSMHEGGCRVPGLFRWPGVIPAGVVCDRPAMSIDLYRTFAELAGATVPADRVIDGGNLAPLLRGDLSADIGRDTFPYYRADTLCAVRRGTWKLHVRAPYEPGVPAIRELYDLAADIGETRDVSAQHPDIVRELETLADHFRAELGDAALGVTGRAVRPAGRVANPRPLTTYDPAHPYYAPEYDLDHRG